MLKDQDLEPKLRPGEIKILKALVKGKKAFEDLASETKLNRTCLSDYLKRLQKIGLIVKDIETRKYHVTEDFSEETLFVSDIAQLIQSQVDKTVCEKNSFSFGVGFCTVENNSLFLKRLETAFTEKSENLEALTKIHRLVSDTWHDFVLSSPSFNENERKIIRQTEQNSKELDKITHDQLEAKEKEMPYQNYSFTLTLSDTEKNRYDEILSFSGNKKNQKIWEKWFNKRSDPPKTVLVFTPLGFSSVTYQQRIENLLPEKTEKDGGV